MASPSLCCPCDKAISFPLSQLTSWPCVHRHVPTFEPKQITQDLVLTFQMRQLRLDKVMWPAKVPQPRRGGTGPLALTLSFAHTRIQQTFTQLVHYCQVSREREANSDYLLSTE